MSSSKLLIKLLDYVLEQDKDIDPRSFNLQSHQGFVKSQAALQALPGVEMDLRSNGDHVWLRVARLEKTSPPTPTGGEWVDCLVYGDTPDGRAPEIDQRRFKQKMTAMLPNESQPGQGLSAASLLSTAQQALERYSAQWRAWAATEVLRRSSMALYGELFALKHQLESAETNKPYELVWGMGVAAWQLPGDERSTSGKISYQYPLITQAMELALDEESLAIELRPRALEPRFEFDAFAACLLNSTPDVERAAQRALREQAERSLLPFDSASYEHYLKLIAGNLHDKGRYSGLGERFPLPGEDLEVSAAWVILARPRANNYLHEDIERLKKRLAYGHDIPQGPQALVTPPSAEPIAPLALRFRGLSGMPSHAPSGGEVRELFFPLPYNQEQVTIIEELERSNGVVVQGPPGTGKTHTIANIICHYLATGRKVLVTSKGEQALQVLQSKIPPAVQPLTVALLSGDREGLRQFQASIEAIIHNVSQLNPERVRAEIGAAQSAIEGIHAELAQIDEALSQIAHEQLAGVEVEGKRMSPQQIAEWVVEAQADYAWFDDALSLSAGQQQPLTEAEARELKALRQRLGQDLSALAVHQAPGASLLSCAELAQLHQDLLDLQALEADPAPCVLPALLAGNASALDAARRLLALLERALKLKHELAQSGEAWATSLRQQCGQAPFQSERQALQALLVEAKSLVQARVEFLKRPVALLASCLGSAKLREAIERAAQTGKPFALISFGAAAVKEQIASIQVAGLAPASMADWQHVLNYLKLADKIQSFSVRWNALATVLALPTIGEGWLALRQIECSARLAAIADQLANECDARLPQLYEQVFSQPIATHALDDRVTLGDLEQTLRSALRHVGLKQAASLREQLQSALAPAAGCIADELKAMVQHELGQTGVDGERIVARYGALLASLQRIEALSADYRRLLALAERLQLAGAPRLAARVTSVALLPDGRDSVLPDDWREAWHWARLAGYLAQIEVGERLGQLAARRGGLETALARLYEALVSQSAWLATKLGATPKVLSALETYRTAVRRIGMGTGPNATRHRRDAQKAMVDAQDAVPCWVMSHAKVSETLPARLGCFDLVIVDEASQSDLWAMPTILRGKKILVVGDDKQVSPAGGFMSSWRIQELKDRFLSEQPFAAVLTPEKSLYDLASSVFAAQKVMLREHFRCVPSIIAYSNHFYDGFIQPLRIPKPSERLDPPLLDIFVAGGRRGSKDENWLEAQAIADEIESLIANPCYARRTLGVVSLLGPEQAKTIDSLVRSRIDAQELMRRQFECGDARLFQGSERDIMFLSMVVDPTNCKALSGNTFEQRFNVAASRARDRMVLVRSVELADLAAGDLRRGLLAHFSQPGASVAEEAMHRVERCQSDFERELYGALLERGYRVLPQVQVGAFCIDLVVEGANDKRLAIECDGDELHALARWQTKISHQRVLERVGWVFWRCFAASWHRRRDAVLAGLLSRLASMGIEPLGSQMLACSRVQLRVKQSEVATARPQRLVQPESSEANLCAVADTSNA